MKEKDINRDTVRKIQKLSFPQRADDIRNTPGKDVVTNIVKKYPFLQLEEQVLYSFQL